MRRWAAPPSSRAAAGYSRANGTRFDLFNAEGDVGTLNQIAAQIGSAFGATLGHADVTAQRCLDCVCGAALVAGRLFLYP